MTVPRLLSALLMLALVAVPATAFAQNGNGGDGTDPGVVVQPGNKEYAIPYESQRTQAAPAKKPAAKKQTPVRSATPAPQSTPAPTYATPSQPAATATKTHAQARHKAVKRHAAKKRHAASTATPAAKVVAPVAATSSSSGSGSPALLIAAIVAGTLLVGAGVGIALRRRGGGRLGETTTP